MQDNSFLLGNLLAKNQSFLQEADALLFQTINYERYRALRVIDSIDQVHADIKNGTSVTDFLGDIGQLSNVIGAALGLGSKAIGGISELPMAQQIQVNNWRFTKTRAEHKLERARAMRRTPDPGAFGFNADLDSISLFPGQIAQPRDQVQNKYGPVEAGMFPYSRSAGAEAVADYLGKVFPFSITNLARIAQSREQFTTPLQQGLQKNGPPQPTEIFPAYIRALNEQFNATWSQRGYLGRSEDVYIYNNASRSFNLDITLFATNDDQPKPRLTPDNLQGPGLILEDGGYPIPVSDLISVPSIPFLNDNTAAALMDNNITKTDLWKKISFLESLCYPAYDDDGRFSRSPFCRITLGSLYEDQLMIIQSVNIAYDPLVWDINGNHYTPMFANITIAGVLIHDSSPGIGQDGEFGYYNDAGQFRFLHRSDFR
jgi:hypothetical protein